MKREVFRHFGFLERCYAKSGQGLFEGRGMFLQNAKVKFCRQGSNSRIRFAKGLLARHFAFLMVLGAGFNFLSSGAKMAHAMSMEEIFNKINERGSESRSAALYSQVQSLYNDDAGEEITPVPESKYRLLTVKPPSWEAGCGGIDLYMGGLSFIDKDSFVQMMRNIGKGALGYGFKIAIQNLCPTCDNIMQSLQDVAQKINRLNIDTCEVAQGLAQAAFGTNLTRNKQTAARNLGTQQANLYSDGAEAWTKVMNSEQEADRALDVITRNRPEMNDTLPRGNVVWKALKKLTGLNDDEREMLMSLVGTVVFKTGGGGDKSGIRWVSDSGIRLEQLVGRPTERVVLPVLRCGTDRGDCMNPEPKTLEIKTFSQMVEGKIAQISRHIAQRTSYENRKEVYRFLNVTGLPIYKMVAVYSQLNNELALLFNSTHVQLIAIKYADVYLRRALRDVRDALQNLNAVAEAAQSEAIQKLDQRIDEVLRASERKLVEAYQRAAQSYDRAQQALFIERRNSRQILNRLSRLQPGQVNGFSNARD